MSENNSGTGFRKQILNEVKGQRSVSNDTSQIEISSGKIVTGERFEPTFLRKATFLNGMHADVVFIICYLKLTQILKNVFIIYIYNLNVGTFAVLFSF